MPCGVKPLFFTSYLRKFTSWHLSIYKLKPIKYSKLIKSDHRIMMIV